MATGVDAKLLKSTKFPPEFSQKVDMTKVNLQVMKKWIASKISEILGSEDDVVIELCFNLIEGPRFPDIKSLQIQLTGFLDKDTAPFCKDLWVLCLSAQTSPQGVPKELLEAKKMELIQEKLEADKAAEEARKRREEFENRRPRGGRVDSWRGGRGGDRDSYNGRGRGFGRGRSPSRSPPPSRRGGRRESFRGPARGRDSYMPGGRTVPRRDDRRRRSPSRSSSIASARSRSRSRSSSRGGSRRRSRPDIRKRSRSPIRGENNYRPGRRRSPSAAPTPKRRRYSSSRSRSPDKRRRARSRSSSLDRRSLSRSRSPPRKRRSRNSRSRSASPGRARRNGRGRGGLSRSRSRSRSKSPRDSRRLSRYRSRSRSSSRGGGRRRDKRRNSSSISSKHRSPDNTADSDHEDRRPKPPKSLSKRADESKPTEAPPQFKSEFATQQANELREKELRDLLIKRRRSSAIDASTVQG